MPKICHVAFVAQFLPLMRCFFSRFFSFLLFSCLVWLFTCLFVHLSVCLFICFFLTRSFGNEPQQVELELTDADEGVDSHLGNTSPMAFRSFGSICAE
ncbi:hypothetical protein GGI43DRAFT_67847 [Trichoderma evansii]